jgi:hypothetical protein
VYVHPTNGTNDNNCGLLHSPCQTFFYAVNTIATTGMKVRLLYDPANYTFGSDYFSFPSKSIDVGGISDVVGGVVTYPTLLYNFGTDVFFLYDNGYSSYSYLFTYLTFAINATGSMSESYLFFQSADGDDTYVRFEFGFI